MRNVSRVWAYETGLAAGVELGPGMYILSLILIVFVPVLTWRRNTCQ